MDKLYVVPPLAWHPHSLASVLQTLTWVLLCLPCRALLWVVVLSSFWLAKLPKGRPCWSKPSASRSPLTVAIPSRACRIHSGACALHLHDGVHDVLLSVPLMFLLVAPQQCCCALLLFVCAHTAGVQLRHGMHQPGHGVLEPERRQQRRVPHPKRCGALSGAERFCNRLHAMLPGIPHGSHLLCSPRGYVLCAGLSIAEAKVGPKNAVTSQGYHNLGVALASAECVTSAVCAPCASRAQLAGWDMFAPGSTPPN